jgi:hypothetical protein
MSLLDKVKETAQKGADKAKEVGKAGQDKLESVKVERKIKELKEELGGVVYAQRSGNPPANAETEVVRIVAEISEAEASLAEAQAADADAAPEDTSADTAD